MVAVGSRAGPGVIASTSLGSRLEAFSGALLRESVSREVPDARGEHGARR